MMIKALEDEGLAVITPKVGDLFDGDIEQIVDVIETEDEKLDNHIAEVLLNGYKLKERLLRPGNVKIYKLKTTKEVVNEEDNEKLN
jgi:molecular chaperone GrpE (heat shock protein)